MILMTIPIKIIGIVFGLIYWPFVDGIVKAKELIIIMEDKK